MVSFQSENRRQGVGTRGKERADIGPGAGLQQEFGQAPGDGEGQGSLVCFSPWDHKDLDATGQLNNSNILLPGCITVCLSFHLMKSIFTASKF